MNIIKTLADELAIKPQQVEAVMQLLDEGATIPFIARYRKEATNGLDDTQLRQLDERLIYLNELETRRQTILASIDEQGKLTPNLKQQILAADNKARLEDYYLPYKPKRHTKAQIAIEAGLEPLADALLKDTSLIPETAAAKYLNPDKAITNVQEALDGARQILMERFAQDAELINKLREYVWSNAVLVSNVVKTKQEEAKKFSDYFAYQEALKKIPSHRALALFRGQKAGFLRVTIEFVGEEGSEFCIRSIAQQFAIKTGNSAGEQWLANVIASTWRSKLKLKTDVDLLMRLREQAGDTAIDVFKNNMKNLLMAAAAGGRVTLGLDPGLRTGVKVVVVDETGKLLDYTVIYPHVPRNAWDASIATLKKLCQQHNISLVSIGNGTASRETETLVTELQKNYPDLKLTAVVVSEAGASIYSASALAAEEFPDLDVSYRGAVSIARRLQDPLAELVKIDPKSIGVGQYQHDINQLKLGHSLDAVVEDCVNAVGADINTASVPLLAQIAGLNSTVASNIVQYREDNGRFANREAIKAVPRLGEKTYQQAAGFLRIINGENPLDASAVHPESYALVDQIIQATGKNLDKLIGNKAEVDKLKANDFANDQYGLPTVIDVLAELKKPGRDPRPEFTTATFKEGVNTLSDLKVDMRLEGVITNVTNFGAFVDIGVHQDGLVHISQLADKFVADPHDVVKVGQIVKVRVQEVDLPRQRIALSMKQQQAATPRKSKPASKPTGSFGDALQKAFKR